MNKNKLLISKLLRESSNDENGKKQKRISVDFIIDGKSLLNTLNTAFGGHGDYMGCFVHGYKKSNKNKYKELLLEVETELESKRVLLYVCPECGDIGCGAFACKIIKHNDSFVWTDFAYENGYEEPKKLILH